MTVASVFPTVARDLEGPSDPASREDNRFRPKNFEAAALAIIPKRPYHALAVFEQSQDGVLHEDVDSLVDAVVLEGADHFQAGAITHVGEARVLVTAEIALQNPTVFR